MVKGILFPNLDVKERFWMCQVVATTSAQNEFGRLAVCNIQRVDSAKVWFFRLETPFRSGV